MDSACFEYFSAISIGAPAGLLILLGLPALLGYRWSETVVVGLSKGILLAGLAALVGMAVVRWTSPPDRPLVFTLTDWVVLPEAAFHFRIEFIFDWLSIPFAILANLLCGLIAAFAANYLHREPGFYRFFFLFATFLLGLVVAILAATIETLFFGWELVGLSSALLVAFFQDRPAPVRNGLRVWGVYRVADGAFLIAAAVLHHLSGVGELQRLTGEGSWPYAAVTLPLQEALFVGMLLVVAAAGKSALVPFSGWLPRAMEGPTPSSAVFYGALSIHLGAYLLLRVGPLLDLVPALSILVFVLGLATALTAAIAGQVQSDIKSALAYASLTQVGLIVAEIGWGWRYIPLFHILGHACLRTLQLLRAPTLLKDYQRLESALGTHVSNRSGGMERWLPLSIRRTIYRCGLERWYLDGLLDRWLVHPLQQVFSTCDRLERRWTDWLSGVKSRESDDLRPSAEVMEELR